MLERIKNSIYLKEVSSVGLGSLSAQVFGLLGMLIITRYYSPSELALLALITAIVTIFIPIAAGRYETVVVIAKARRESLKIAKIAIIITVITLSLLYIIFFAFGNHLIFFFGTESLGKYFYAIPLLIFLGSIIKIYNNLDNSFKNYRLLSSMLAFHSFLTVTFSIIFGIVFSHEETNWLIVSVVLSSIISVLVYTYKYKNSLGSFKDIRIKNSIILIRKYADFPLYNAPASILNTFALSLPILLLTKYFDSNVVGQYSLITKIVFGPLAFISVAISTIHLKKITDLIFLKERLSPYLFKVTLMLVLIASLPFTLLTVFAEEMIGILFSDQWHDAGRILQIMAPAFALRFVVSAISTTISATRNLKWYTIWTLIDIAQIFLLFSYFPGKLNIYDFFGLMALFSFLSYSLYFLIIFVSANRVDQKYEKNI